MQVKIDDFKIKIFKELKFLNDTLKREKELEQYSSEKVSISKDYGFEWNGNKNDMVELVYGLIEAGVLKFEDKYKVVKGFSYFLGARIDNPNTQLQDIKSRKGKNKPQTELIDKMKNNFIKYLNRLE